jgi:glycosyltransferase involved in cell wall biosynthesis
MAKNIAKQNQEIRSPLVSVVMSAYNCEKYVAESIESILSQTFTNFEFIIINDGSTDDTLRIIKKYKDPRIILISRENRGLVYSLNEGISIARGKYIARQDADDISTKNRLALQYDLAEKNEAVLVGSSFEVIGNKGDYISMQATPISDRSLKRALYVRNPFAHGSTMFLRESFMSAGSYSSAVGPAEDYDLWLKLSRLGRLVASKEILYRWRANHLGISYTKSEQQIASFESLRKAYAERYPPKLTLSFSRLVDYYRHLLAISPYSQDLASQMAHEEVAYIGLLYGLAAKLAQFLQALMYFPKSCGGLLRSVVGKFRKVLKV